MQQLWEACGIPILQLHQLPLYDWEWKHLIGFVGPHEESKAHHANLDHDTSSGKPTHTRITSQPCGTGIYQIIPKQQVYTVHASVEAALADSSSTTNTSIRMLRKISL
jgi:hypothetical protein